ncbi:hypothetical protein [Xanthomonas arboricola]|uniref:hypothetical protein n=1 Tax=Xanthomonas arboricola TaxID=56448 RepID=UPI000C868F14|nr:hypothetical protein [Xanthomonas arboricola]PMR89097.1 hypothetical protein C1H21_08560 [Xanthomonas arboricola pv. juglandis]
MKPSETQANILAGQLLILATQRVSTSFDTFSGWLAAGFGAALALFIANLDTVSKFSSLSSIKCASILFLVSALLAVIDKLLAAFIAAGTTAATEGAAFGKDLAQREIEFDVTTFFAETEKALFWPASLFARRAFTKAKSGDFAGPGRMYTKVAQIQALVVVTQAILSLAAAVAIVSGLAV